MGKPRAHDPLRLDVEAAAADGAHLEGHWPLQSLDRLAEGSTGDVAWSAAFEQRRRSGVAPETWLDLRAATEVTRECQRCLRPVRLPLTVERSFRFAADEASAAALDADSDEDVLVGSRRFDLRELVEDELLLALPLVPRHERCPQPLPLEREAAAEAAAASPFAVLAGLKRRSGG